MDNTNTLVISLVRKAVNPDYVIDKAVLAAADWSEVISVCAAQGVLGLCFETIETLEEHRPPRPVLMRWIGELVNLENTYRIHSLALEHLAELYREEDIKLLLLKYASTFPHCSMKSSEYLWPKTKRLVKDERRSKSKLRVCA